MTCDLPQTVNFVLWIIASFNVAVGGFFVFLIFGTSKGVVAAWGDLILFVVTRGRRRSLFGSSGGTTEDSAGSKKIKGVPATGSAKTDMTHSTEDTEPDDTSYREESYVDTDSESDHELSGSPQDDRSDSKSDREDEAEKGSPRGKLSEIEMEDMSRNDD